MRRNRAGSTTPTISSQQILQQDGSVFSVQWLTLPERYGRMVTAPFLLERYLRYIREVTLSLIRPVLTSDGIQFRLLSTRLALLSFAAPRQNIDARREEVRLPINGGFLVQARGCSGGVFSFFVVRNEEGVRVKVQLAEFCPLLLGCAKPSLLHKLCYRFTQAWIHRIVTVGFLSRIYRDLTGDKRRLEVREVMVREGMPI